MPNSLSIGLCQKARTGVIAATALLVVAVVASVGCKPIYKTRTPRFAEDVKKVADASELQQWGMAILQETKQADMTEISKDRVPTGIRTLISDGSPLQDVFCDSGSAQNRTVWLVWGGGFGHWGIRIGPPSFKVSPNDDNYYIEWKPGVYFWHQTH
jgi:hypothetical protein